MGSGGAMAAPQMRAAVALTLALFVGSAAAVAQPPPLAEPVGVTSDAELAAIPMRKPRAVDFAAYPAAPYRGAVVQPAFRGPQHSYYLFRTSIRRGVRGGPRFAGRFAFITVGCGTGCLSSVIADLKTGLVHDVPGSGEQHSYQDLDYRPDSAVLKERWPATSSAGHPVYCITEVWKWTGSGFVTLDRARERIEAADWLAADCAVPR